MPRRRATEGGGAVEPAAPKLARGTRRKLLPVVAERPRTRGDCLPGGLNEARPCHQDWCRHRLYAGGESCALDVAGPGPAAEVELARTGAPMRGPGRTLAEVAAFLGRTRARVSQIEALALRRLAPLMSAWRDGADDAEDK